MSVRRQLCGSLALSSKLSTPFPLPPFPLKAKHEMSKPVPGITGAACASTCVSNDSPDLLENPACGRALCHAKPMGVTVGQKQSAEFRIVKTAPLTCKGNHSLDHSPSPETQNFLTLHRKLKKYPALFQVLVVQRERW